MRSRHRDPEWSARCAWHETAGHWSWPGFIQAQPLDAIRTVYHLCYAFCVMTTNRNQHVANVSFHDRHLAAQMKDPAFRAEFERASREIQAIDAIVNTLDSLRATQGLSKAELAREIGKNPASVRRLLTARSNPELRTVVAMADALDADVVIVPRSRRGRRTSRTPAAA
jgi:DNA-binding phage protein